MDSFLWLRWLLYFCYLHSLFGRSEDLFHFSCKAPYYWLHVPKTSSTFCLSLQHVCCTDRFENVTAGITIDQILEHQILKKSEQSFEIATAHGCAFMERKGIGSSLSHCMIKNNQHHPLPSAFNLSNPVLIMLRDPTTRLISSFLDAHHHEGMDEDHFKKLKERMFSESSDSTLEETVDSPNTIRKLVHAARVYSEDMSMKGCQTKMILGFECSDSQFVLPEKFNETIALMAIEKLKRFYFVGIFEEYTKSIELFHAQVDQRTEPSVVELVPTRGGDHLRATILRKYFVNYTDPYDKMVYEAGNKIFQRRYNQVFKGL